MCASARSSQQRVLEYNATKKLNRQIVEWQPQEFSGTTNTRAHVRLNVKMSGAIMWRRLTHTLSLYWLKILLTCITLKLEGTGKKKTMKSSHDDKQKNKHGTCNNKKYKTIKYSRIVNI